jgi:hypothetical protein
MEINLHNVKPTKPSLLLRIIKLTAVASPTVESMVVSIYLILHTDLLNYL